TVTNEVASNPTQPHLVVEEDEEGAQKCLIILKETGEYEEVPDGSGQTWGESDVDEDTDSSMKSRLVAGASPDLPAKPGEGRKSRNRKLLALKTSALNLGSGLGLRPPRQADADAGSDVDNEDAVANTSPVLRMRPRKVGDDATSQPSTATVSGHLEGQARAKPGDRHATEDQGTDI
ncbi:hypothetical protein EGW08_012376, partial [Elysia chlorotica]